MRTKAPKAGVKAALAQLRGVTRVNSGRNSMDRKRQPRCRKGGVRPLAAYSIFVIVSKQLVQELTAADCRAKHCMTIPNYCAP